MVSDEEFSATNVAYAAINFKALVKMLGDNDHFSLHMSGDGKPHPNLPRHTTRVNDGYESKLRKQNNQFMHLHPTNLACLRHDLLGQKLWGDGVPFSDTEEESLVERIVPRDTVGVRRRTEKAAC